MLSRIQEWTARTEIDTSVARQKYITNQVLDEHSRAPLCTRCAWNTGAHCRARSEVIGTKELAEAETASHAADSVLSSPGATGQNVTTEEVNADQIVERDGGASCQLDATQNATTTATKQRAVTQLTTNSVEGGIGGLRSVAGHQDERADSMLPAEAVKYFANTILVSVSSMNITPESCGTETSALRSISV